MVGLGGLLALALLGLMLVLMSEGSNLPVPRKPDVVSGEVIGGTLGKDGDVEVSQDPNGSIVVEKAGTEMQLVVSTKSGWCEMMLFEPNASPTLSSNGWYVIAADNIDDPHEEGTPCFPRDDLNWDALLDALFKYPSGREQFKEIAKALIEAYLKHGRIPLN